MLEAIGFGLKEPYCIEYVISIDAASSSSAARIFV
jgi:hypothetical protein